MLAAGTGLGLIALDVAQSKQRQRPRNAAHHRQQVPPHRVWRCRRRLCLTNDAEDQPCRNAKEKCDIAGSKSFVKDEWPEQQQVERCGRLQKDRVCRRRQLG
jgi:hypothetical protein